MLVLLSPAKNLNEARAAGHAATAPRFLSEAAELAALARTWSEAQIAQVMDISPALAALNHARFASWEPEAGPGLAAALLFDGDVYKELDFLTLEPTAREAADRRLRILSGLYGLLRPLDAVRAYRLEMGRKLPGHPAGTLYRFWGVKIAEAVAADARVVPTGTVLNLASEEYAKAVDRRALAGMTVIEPRFEEDRGGVRRMISFSAKRARGAMARWVLQTGAAQPDDLAGFTVGGYLFDPSASSLNRPVFVREQPAAAARA